MRILLFLMKMERTAVTCHSSTLDTWTPIVKLSSGDIPLALSSLCRHIFILESDDVTRKSPNNRPLALSPPLPRPPKNY